MKLLAILLTLLTLATPVWGQTGGVFIVDPTNPNVRAGVTATGELKTTGSGGGGGAGDTVGTAGDLGSAEATVTVAMAGQNSALLACASGTLNGVVVAEYSLDGGTSYASGGTNLSAAFVTAAGATQTALTFGGADPAIARAIIVPAGATNVRARVSAPPTLVSEADGSINGSNFVLSWNDIDSVAREYQWLILGDEAVAIPARLMTLMGVGR